MQDGIIATCKVFYKVWQATLAKGFEFIKWNPAVGEQCTGLFLGYYYCVGIPGTPTATTWPNG
ncbi:LysM domain-containing protein [Cordyceps militaris]|uniref:LysM domain-containing protein n=1 Tax=Cordyceps militaris TaxID=73501 RepID=A0A2H4S9B5_CORMI|nr:LysM domain-containing protein [Cordyceps militaris]